MRPKTLAELASRLAVPLPRTGGGAGAATLTGITHDSRSVRPGDLYAALPGARVHGADFVASAAAAGAAAVLTDPEGGARVRTGLPVLVVDAPRARLGELAAWMYDEPARSLTMLGITGTNGKTTTSYLVEACLLAAGRVPGIIGTIETRIGQERVPSVRTTPEAPDLQALLAVMRERGVDTVVMEVSSHALALGRVDGIVFDVAVFTNLSQDHLDFHADLEDYFQTKAALFTPARSRLGVVDVDDPYGARLAAGTDAPGVSAVPVVPVVSVATQGGSDADWRVVDREVACSASTTGFTLQHRDGRAVHAVSPLAGDFNVANTALAVVACVVIGVPTAEAVRGLVDARVPGRMERVQATGIDEPLAVVDYAHTPEAVESVLAALRPGLTGRLVVVLGAGGDRDAAKRPLMGAAAARHADVVVVTDDNPRGEDPAGVRAGVLEGAHSAAATSGAQVIEVADRRTAIGTALRGTGPGDAVAVLGKGHEPGQEVAGVVHPFDDREVVLAALQAWNDERDPEASGVSP